MTPEDKNIIQNHTDLIQSVTKYLDDYKFSFAGEALYEYFWHNFCDVYIENSKKQMENSDVENYNADVANNTKKILIKTLSESLIMLHSFIPFVTEAVWQELRKVYPKLSESIMIANWPKERA